VGLGPAASKLVQVADSNPLLVTLGLPRTISCMAYEWLSLHLILWYSHTVPGTGFLISSFHHRTSDIIPLALSVLIALGSLI
jgi:hypothetical protein